MKRLLLVICYITIVFSLYACSQSPVPTPSPTPVQTDEPPRTAVPQVVIDAVNNSEKEIKKILLYNEDGLLIEEDFFFFHNINSSRPLMDSTGNVIESGKYDFSYELFKYTYDTKGKLLTKVWSWENDKSEYDDVLMETNTYDAYGRLIKKEAVLDNCFDPENDIYRFDDLRYGTYFYSYDDNDNIVEEIRDCENNDQKICYEYDKHHRRIKQVLFESPDISLGDGEVAKTCSFKYYDDNCLKECTVNYDDYSLLIRFYDGNKFQQILQIDTSDNIECKTICKFNVPNEGFKESFYYYENGELIEQRVIYDPEDAIVPDDYYFYSTIHDIEKLLEGNSESTEDTPTASDDVFIQYYHNGAIKAIVEYKQELW